MITRAAELHQLETIYKENGNSLHILYGREGCGKDILLQLFCKEKKVFYYHARNASAAEQLRQMQREIAAHFDATFHTESYDECFNRIKSGDASKLVVIIDDFDRIAKKDAPFLESIGKLRSKKLYPGPVMILLLHSSLRWAGEEMEACFGESFDKVDGVFSLSDVGFLDVARAFSDYSVPQCVEAYGIIGGVTDYLNRWNGSKSIRENICNNILRKNGYLFAEAERYIGSELRELSVYDTILASIARGNEKLNDLFIDTGYSRAKISVYLKNLAAFDVIEKVVSFETGGWDNAKKGVYRIKNHYINFWFTFVYPHLSDLYRLSAEDFYDAYIAPDLDAYLSRYFISVCTEYLALLNRVGQLPLQLTHMGTWVGKDGQIDIIGQNAQRENVVGLCNWTEEELSFERYEALLEQMKKARIKANVIYLFSAKRFDARVRALAKEDDSIVLVDMNEL